MPRGEEGQRLHPLGCRGKLLSEPGLWEAQTFGLAFDIWDIDWIAANVPPHIRALWAARYAIEPWDAANRYALAKMQYTPPDAVQDLIEEHEEKHPAPKKRQFLSGRALRRRMKKAMGS